MLGTFADEARKEHIILPERTLPAMALYRKIADLTPDEIVAAKAYGAESGFFHLACQGSHNMALTDFKPYQDFLKTQETADLQSATSTRYELTTEITVFSGQGSGVGVVGALGHRDPTRLQGLTWRYRGFTSTSIRRCEAEKFLNNRKTDRAVLLEFRLSSGFRLLPLEVLGVDWAGEGEFLIPANITFSIVRANTSANGYLHLRLETP